MPVLEALPHDIRGGIIQLIDVCSVASLLAPQYQSAPDPHVRELSLRVQQLYVYIARSAIWSISSFKMFVSDYSEPVAMTWI